MSNPLNHAIRTRNEAIELLMANGQLTDEELALLQKNGELAEKKSNKELEDDEDEYNLIQNEELERSGSGRAAARTAKDVAVGITSVADAPNLVALALHAAKLKKAPHFWHPVSDKLNKYINEKTDNYTKPVGSAERLASAGVQAVATLPGMQTVGIAAKASKLANAGNKIKKANALNKTNVSITAGSGLAAETARQHDPDNWWLPIVAGTAGGAGVGAGINKIGRAKPIDMNVYNAYKDMGVKPGLIDVLKRPHDRNKADALEYNMASRKQIEDHRSAKAETLKQKSLAENPLSMEEFADIALDKSIKLRDKEKKQIKERYDQQAAAVDNLANKDIELNNVITLLERERPIVQQKMLSGTDKYSKYLREILGVEPSDVKNIDFSRPIKESLQSLKHDKVKFQNLDYDLPLDVLMNQIDSKSAPATMNYHLLDETGKEIKRHVKTDKVQRNFAEARLQNLSNAVNADLHSVADMFHSKADVKNNKELRAHYAKSMQDVQTPISRILEKAQIVYDSDHNKSFASAGAEQAIDKAIISDLRPGKNGEGLAVKQILHTLNPAKKVGDSIVNERAAFVKTILNKFSRNSDGEMDLSLLQKNFYNPEKVSINARKILLNALPEKERSSFLNVMEIIKHENKISKKTQGTKVNTLAHSKQTEPIKNAEKIGLSAILSGGLSEPTTGLMIWGAGKLGANKVRAKYLTDPKHLEWKIASREKGAGSKAILEGALRGLVGSGAH